MKKRKFSLFLNIACICLAVCSIAFGVYAIKNASLNIGGTVGFKAHNCNISATCSIEGAIDENMQTVTKEETFTSIDGNKFDLGKIYFDNYNQNYTKAITLKFKLKNNSEFPVMVSVDVPASDKIYCASSVIMLEANSNEYDYAIDLMNKTFDDFSVANYNLSLVATKTTYVEENQTDGWYGSVADGKYTITQLPTLENNNNSTELIIPNIIKKSDGAIVPVTNINRSDGKPISMDNIDLYTKITVAYGLESQSICRSTAGVNTTVTSLILPKSLKSFSISGYGALKSLTIPAFDGILSMVNSTNGLEDLFVPNGVTSIEYVTAKKIHIPDSVTNIISLSKLEQVPYFPNSVSKISVSGTFSTITLPNSIKELGMVNSNNLTSLIIPSSTTKVLNPTENGGGMIGGTSFEKIYIPSGVTINLFSFTTKNASSFKIYTSESSFPSYWEQNLAKNNYIFNYNSSLDDFNAG